MKRSEKLLRPRHHRAGRITPERSRSVAPYLAKVTISAPGALAVPVQKSERTIAQEAPCIRLTVGRARMMQLKKKGQQRMKEGKEITHYGGFDWARDHHAVVIVNQQGRIVSQFQFDHSVEGWKKFRQESACFAKLAVAIETNQGRSRRPTAAEWIEGLSG